MNRFCFCAPLVIVAAVCAVGSFVPPAGAADEIAPSVIVASPADYEGKPVSVSGTVAKYQTNKTLMGSVAAYQLCDTKCIVVIDETNTSHKDGDKVTASGTFQSTFKGPKRSFTNVVVIK